jgi:hypothetical protein
MGVKWILQAQSVKTNVIPRRSSLLTRSTLPSIHAFQPQSLKSHPSQHLSLNPPRHIPRNKMNDQTHVFGFDKFNYYIVGMFAEYLNDIEQHSYKKLTNQWWIDCYTEISPLIKENEDNSQEIQKIILEKVTSKYSKELLTDDHVKNLKSGLANSYFSFYNKLYPVCYCGHRECDWDCGVLWCGCIDVCRGRCGFGDRYNRW